MLLLFIASIRESRPMALSGFQNHSHYFLKLK